MERGVDRRSKSRRGEAEANEGEGGEYTGSLEGENQNGKNRGISGGMRRKSLESEMEVKRDLTGIGGSLGVTWRNSSRED